MARIKYTPGIDKVTGALSKEGLVQRQKHLYGPDGKLVRVCNSEVYIVRNPRDFSTNPSSGSELAHQLSFGIASKQANALIKAVKSGMATPEQMAAYESYLDRFNRQLQGTPDPRAPKDAKGHGKLYGSFNCFVRAIIYYDLLAM